MCRSGRLVGAVFTMVVVRTGVHAVAMPRFVDVMGVTVGVTAGTVMVPVSADVGWTIVCVTMEGMDT
uniref:Uncharacterized protein n=1 Tax=Ixodes ricinus TaxID=34613 RepID=A0A6B0TYZ5_IXORI